MGWDLTQIMVVRELRLDTPCIIIKLLFENRTLFAYLLFIVLKV